MASRERVNCRSDKCARLPLRDTTLLFIICHLERGTVLPDARHRPADDRHADDLAVPHRGERELVSANWRVVPVQLGDKRVGLGEGDGGEGEAGHAATTMS